MQQGYASYLMDDLIELAKQEKVGSLWIDCTGPYSKKISENKGFITKVSVEY